MQVEYSTGSASATPAVTQPAPGAPQTAEAARPHRSALRRRLRQFGLVLTAFMPQPVKRLVYRWGFGYRIGRGVRIGVSYLDCEALEIGEGASIGHANAFVGCGAVRLGPSATIGFANVFRGGDAVDLASYATVGRLNVINAIPEPVVVNPIDSRFSLGHGAVVVSEHRIDFTDRVIIGQRSILAGRNSSIWTHNRQRTRPVTIGDFCFVGSEIRMAPGSRIPDRSMVGLGAVVTHAFDEPGQMIAGVPARAARPLEPDDLDFLYFKTRPDLPDLPGIDDASRAAVGS